MTATICVTTISVVFIYCLFRHLDSTGFSFKNKVIKDIYDLQESEGKTKNTFFKIEKEMMEMKERIDRIEYHERKE